MSSPPQASDSRDAADSVALKSMGADFLNSYTKMVDGEKDPRNLMLLFAMDRVILLEFDISDMVEVSWGAVEPTPRARP